MHIVPDANVIIAEGYGDSDQFRALLSALETSGHRLYVPRSVLEEIVARFESVFDRDATRVAGALESLSRRLGRQLPSPLGAVDRAQESALFRRRLEALFDNSNCGVLDYPDIEHEELVRRAARRIRPFNEGGSGYRDALIWEAVMRLAATTSSQIALVTSDNAFYHERQGNALHGDLINEMAERGMPSDKVIVMRSVRAFRHAYIDSASHLGGMRL